MIRETRKKKCNSPSEFFEVRMLKKCYSLATRIYRKMPHNRFFILIRAAVIYHVYNRFFNLLGQKKKAEIVEVKGMKMVYNAYFPRWIFFFNQWKIKDHEEPAFSLFDSLVRGGMTVLDIGASTGFFTLKACRKVGEKGQVFSFEPDKRRFSILRRNIELNNYNNVKIFNLTIDCQTHLDSFVETADVVAIDVEGQEYCVLKGMNALLKKSNIKLIVEVHPKFISPDNHQKTYTLLQKYGFKLSFARAGDNKFTSNRQQIEGEKFYYLFATKRPP